MIAEKYSQFKSENIDQYRGYEAGTHDGASHTFDTVANWIEEDFLSGNFDAKRYVKVLRDAARKLFKPTAPEAA